MARYLFRTFLVTLLPALALAGSAHAQSGRTFVSGLGVDAGGCTRTAPCRTFAFAINATNAGGEIAILDTAGYGPVTITKSLGIINEGVGEAGVTTTMSGDAIAVAAGVNDNVTLRGLTIVGAKLGTNGISYSSGNLLNIQNCVIRDFAGNGIFTQNTTSGRLNVSDTIVSGSTADGIAVTTAAGGSPVVTVTLTRVQLLDNGNKGLHLVAANAGTIKGVATDSVFSGGTTPVYVEAFPTATQTSLSVTNSVIANGQTGIVVGGPAFVTAFLAGTTISGNQSPFTAGPPASLFSYGNNYIGDNATAGSGSLTTIPQK